MVPTHRQVQPHKRAREMSHCAHHETFHNTANIMARVAARAIPVRFQDRFLELCGAKQLQLLLP